MFIFYYFKKPKLNEYEINELENQQLLVVKLFNDFENNLAKIRDILNNEKLENTNKIDIDEKDIECHFIDKTESDQMVRMNQFN